MSTWRRHRQQVAGPRGRSGARQQRGAIANNHTTSTYSHAAGNGSQMLVFPRPTGKGRASCRLEGGRSAPHLAEVTGVVLVHHDAVVVLATGVTATGRMLAVLANAAMAGADVTAVLAVVSEPCAQNFQPTSGCNRTTGGSSRRGSACCLLPVRRACRLAACSNTKFCLYSCMLIRQ